MTNELRKLLQHLELTKLIIENVFQHEDAVYGSPQMDLFQEDIDKQKIGDVAVLLYKLCQDDNFVQGAVALLEAVLLPSMTDGEFDEAL